MTIKTTKMKLPLHEFLFVKATALCCIFLDLYIPYTYPIFTYSICLPDIYLETIAFLIRSTGMISIANAMDTNKAFGSSMVVLNTFPPISMMIV